MEGVKWIDPCRICKNEVCSIVDHFVKTKQANSVREATRILSEQIGGEIPAATLRTLVYRKRLVSNETTSKLPKSFKKPPESKQVLTLQELIESDQKFGTHSFQCGTSGRWSSWKNSHQYGGSFRLPRNPNARQAKC